MSDIPIYENDKIIGEFNPKEATRLGEWEDPWSQDRDGVETLYLLPNSRFVLVRYENFFHNSYNDGWHQRGQYLSRLEAKHWMIQRNIAITDAFPVAALREKLHPLHAYNQFEKILWGDTKPPWYERPPLHACDLEKIQRTGHLPFGEKIELLGTQCLFLAYEPRRICGCYDKDVSRYGRADAAKNAAQSLLILATALDLAERLFYGDVQVILPEVRLFQILELGDKWHASAHEVSIFLAASFIYGVFEWVALDPEDHLEGKPFREGVQSNLEILAERFVACFKGYDDLPHKLSANDEEKLAASLSQEIVALQRWYMQQQHTLAGPKGAHAGVGLTIPENNQNRAEQYVTLDQMAALVNRNKKTLENYLNKPQNKDKAMPEPDIEGGGGKPHEWKWSKIRPWLETTFGKKLPEIFPSPSPIFHQTNRN